MLGGCQSFVLFKPSAERVRSTHIRWLSGKEFTCQGRRHKFDPWVGRFPYSRKWQPIPVFLPGKIHGRRSVMGYSPRGCKESDRTEHAHTISWRTICFTQSPLNVNHPEQCLAIYGHCGPGKSTLKLITTILEGKNT